MAVNVAIVEDNRRFRESVELTLKYTNGFEHVGSFGSVEALAAALENRATAPDRWHVVLMDLDLPGASGIEGIRIMKARSPGTAVVVCTVFEDPATILQAIAAGADGYILKAVGLDSLLDQLRVVADGGSSLSARVARTLLGVVRTLAPAEIGPEPSRLDLTGRERDVLRGLVDGLSYKQVATRCRVSVHTVRTHIRSLYRKLHVQSAPEAVSRALREGLI